MTQEEEIHPIDERIDAIEAHLATMTGMAGEDTAVMVTLSSTLAQLYQAKAQLDAAEQLEQLASFANGIVALLDTPQVSALLAQFGIDFNGGEAGDDEDEEAEEDEEEASGD